MISARLSTSQVHGWCRSRELLEFLKAVSALKLHQEASKTSWKKSHQDWYFQYSNKRWLQRCETLHGSKKKERTSICGAVGPLRWFG